VGKGGKDTATIVTIGSDNMAIDLTRTKRAQKVRAMDPGP